MSYRGFLAEMLMAECDDRARRRSERQIKAAGFPREKSMRAFDFDANPAIDPAVIHTLAACDWVRKGLPLCLIGDSGTGKSHLLIALGTEAAMAGYRVRYTLAAKLVNELVEAADDRQLTKTINRYGRVDLLCVDELGYMELDRRVAELLFQVLTEREEKASVAIASNESLAGPRPSPTPASAPPSSTASPSAATSSRPAPTPTASPRPAPPSKPPPAPGSSPRPPSPAKPPSSARSSRDPGPGRLRPPRPGPHTPASLTPAQSCPGPASTPLTPSSSPRRSSSSPTGWPPTTSASPPHCSASSATPPTARPPSAPTWTASPSFSAATTASSSSAKTPPYPGTRQTAVKTHEQKPPAQPPGAVRTHEQPRSKLTNEANHGIHLRDSAIIGGCVKLTVELDFVC
jgi:hypothetical protein